MAAAVISIGTVGEKDPGMISKQRGFSLFEVMISFAIIGLASLGLIKLQATVEQKADYAMQSIEALHYAERQMELYRTRVEDVSGASGLIAFDQLGNTAHCGAGMADMVSSGYNLVCKVDDVTGSLSGDLKELTVTVWWEKRVADSAEHAPSYAVSLTSYVSKYSEFD